MSDAWVAIAGTVVGAVLTFGFQQINSRTTERSARDERLRSERLAAFSGFAAALLEYRRAQIDRQQARIRNPDSGGGESASADVSRCRVEAWTAFYRVRLTSDDQAVTNAGYEVLTQLRDLKEASALHDVDHRSEEIRYGIERLLKLGQVSVLR